MARGKSALSYIAKESDEVKEELTVAQMARKIKVDRDSKAAKLMMDAGVFDEYVKAAYEISTGENTVQLRKAKRRLDAVKTAIAIYKEASTTFIKSGEADRESDTTDKITEIEVSLKR